MRAALLALALAGCARDPMTPLDHVQLGEETGDEGACQARADAGKASVDACRKQIEAGWDAYWAAYFAAKGGGAK